MEENCFVCEFKELIEQIDDCSFSEMLDQLNEYGINLKKFNEYLDADELDDNEILLLSVYVEIARTIIKEILENKINTLVDIYYKL